MSYKPGIRDKAGEAYWSSLWEDSALPPAIDPQRAGSDNYVVRRLHALFSNFFSGRHLHDAQLLEIGCARSAWLPYFVKQFGFRVVGIDYSEPGCRQAKAILHREQVDGEIMCVDFNFPPESLLENFDVVISFGVAEHFSDTAKCIAGFAQYLKPGGMLITLIPNMTELMGGLQRFLDRAVYDIHVPLDAQGLKRAHEQCGLQIFSCRYFMSTGFGVLNTAKLTGSDLSSRLKRHLGNNLSRVSKGIALLEDLTFQLPPTQFLSPYIVCVAGKGIPE